MDESPLVHVAQFEKNGYRGVTVRSASDELMGDVSTRFAHANIYKSWSVQNDIGVELFVIPHEPRPSWHAKTFLCSSDDEKICSVDFTHKSTGFSSFQFVLHFFLGVHVRYFACQAQCFFSSAVCWGLCLGCTRA